MNKKVRFSDVLKPGSIWRVKSGKLVMVMYLTNLNLDQEKNPSQVVFRCGDDIISCSLKSFKNSVKYVRQDEVGASILSDIFFHEITSKEQTALEEVAESEDGLDEDSGEEQSERSDANNDDEYPIPGAYAPECRLYFREEGQDGDKEEEEYGGLQESFCYYTLNSGIARSHTLGFRMETEEKAILEQEENIKFFFNHMTSLLVDIGPYECLTLTGDCVRNIHVSPALINGLSMFLVCFDEVMPKDGSHTQGEDEVSPVLPDTELEQGTVMDEQTTSVTEVGIINNADSEGGIVFKEGSIVEDITVQEPETVVENPTEPLVVNAPVSPLTFDESKLPKQVQKALLIEPTEQIVQKVERALMEQAPEQLKVEERNE